jgi:hypothetical protein
VPAPPLPPPRCSNRLKKKLKIGNPCLGKRGRKQEADDDALLVSLGPRKLKARALPTPPPPPSSSSSSDHQDEVTTISGASTRSKGTVSTVSLDQDLPPFSSDEDEEEVDVEEVDLAGEVEDIILGMRNEVVCTYVWLLCFVAMKKFQ